MKYSKFKLKFKIKAKKRKQIKNLIKSSFWFVTGAVLTLLFIMFFGFFAYEKYYQGKIFPGIYIENKNFGGITKENVIKYYDDKNKLIENTKFEFINETQIATISAKELDFGYDSKLSAEQAFSLGRSEDFVTNFSILLQAYLNGITLPETHKINDEKLLEAIKPVSSEISKKPVNAIFKFGNGRVITFIPSQNGREINVDKLNEEIKIKGKIIFTNPKTKILKIIIPISILKPEITTEKANSFGIKELIGEGHSLFYHSIPGRIHNVNLASSKINGVLIAPGEIFSFNKALGDVSAFTGYQQAYIIENGKTILGDGGGVCQVSTTFFRAILDAGLPITERHAHAYRVGYYEEDSPPGIDATIFVPSVDLKFKNDTKNYILVQSVIDLNNLSLDFYLYGTKDGRTVSMTTPVVSNEKPPPSPLYQDDPTLPKGEIKQTDFAAWGANVYFLRSVRKNGKVIISDKFVSNYKPWQAAYLVGTKE